MKREVCIKECKKHGFVEHSKRRGHREYGWRCKGCIRDRSIRARRRYKQRALDLLGGKCEICGYDKHWRALCFHHKDPTEKEIAISTFIGLRRNWEELKKEVEKCQLLCLNCHAEVHAALDEELYE